MVFGRGSGHSLSASLCPGLGADSAGVNKQPCCIISTGKTVTGNTPASVEAHLESYSISYPGGDKPKGMIRISLNPSQAFLIHGADKFLKKSWGYI